MKKTIIANWKCHGRQTDVKDWAASAVLAARAYPDIDVVLAAPFVYLPLVVAACAGSGVAVAAQDCAGHVDGAHTGDVSAAMLADIGVTHCIIGHSERRAGHGDTDETVRVKALHAHAAGLTTIICVGESLSARESGQAYDAVAAQLMGSIPASATPDNTIIGYEPIWSISPGPVPTADEITDMFAFIAAYLPQGLAKTANLRMVYGGSVKPANAPQILALPGVAGVLVGAASLDKTAFADIIAAVGKI